MAAAGLRPFGQVREPIPKFSQGERKKKYPRRLTVEDGVASVQAHFILQNLFALSTMSVLEFQNQKHATKTTRRHYSLGNLQSTCTLA